MHTHTHTHARTHARTHAYIHSEPHVGAAALQGDTRGARDQKRCERSSRVVELQLLTCTKPVLKDWDRKLVLFSKVQIPAKNFFLTKSGIMAQLKKQNNTSETNLKRMQIYDKEFKITVIRILMS
jgi:hypothetical protein